MKGRIHRNYSPTGVIKNMEDFAKKMVGKPLMMAGLEIGVIVSAEVDGEYIAWEAELHHRDRKELRA